MLCTPEIAAPSLPRGRPPALYRSKEAASVSRHVKGCHPPQPSSNLGSSASSGLILGPNAKI